MENNNLDELEKIIINRYLEKKDYWLRIRKISKKSNEYKVYYDGIKVFTYTSGNKVFELNKSVFLLNGKNFKNNGKYIEEIPSRVMKDVAKIQEMGFKFTINNKLTIEKSKSNYKKTIEKFYKYREIIKESICKEYSEINNVKLDESKCCFDEEKIIIYLKDTENITYNEIFELEKIGYKYTITERGESKGIQKININENVNLKIEQKCLEKFTEKTLEDIETIMERRIDIYCGNDFIRTKNDSGLEKQYQQKLMDMMNNEREKKIITDNKIQKCFDKNTIPFEEEFTAYKEKNEEGIKSLKGRIDNVFIRGNTLVLVELKYGTGAIGGTNGIHKHLLDILSCFEKESDKNDILQEVNSYIEGRNEILRSANLSNSGFKKLENVEYYIICVYNSKTNDEKVSYTSVKNAINNIYEDTYYSVLKNDRELEEVEKEISKKIEQAEGVKKKKEQKEDREYGKKYENYIKNYKIDDYLRDLRDKRKILNKVEIYLTDEDYKNFEIFER